MKTLLSPSLIRLTLLSAACCFIAACASGNPKNATSSERVSTTPWNKPQSWEGAGPLGGFTQ